MRRVWIPAVVLTGLAVVGGCDEEGPTSVGSGLIGDAFRTYEVVLQGETFLVSDTTYDGLGSLNSTGFSFVAEDFEGVLDAHTLFQVTRPDRLSYEDAQGNSVTDTLYTVIGGQLTVVVDTLADGTLPIDLEVVQLTETWDRRTVSWALRSDTAGTGEPWTEPGGTAGVLLGSATLADGDTLRIALDSAAAAVWNDSAAAVAGGMIRSGTPGSRLRIASVEFEFDVVPAGRQDTVLQAGSLSRPVVIADPEATAPSLTELRVGGVPTWRAALQFESLSDIEIPCPSGAPGCTVPLADVDVNLASLLLDPVPVGPRRIERPLRIDARRILQAPGVPIIRSPLTPPTARMPDSLTAEAFTTTPPDDAVARVPVTAFVRRALDPNVDDPMLWLALTVELEGVLPLFGYGAFGSLESSSPPRLRLLVTVPEEDTQ